MKKYLLENGETIKNNDKILRIYTVRGGKIKFYLEGVELSHGHLVKEKVDSCHIIVREEACKKTTILGFSASVSNIKKIIKNEFVKKIPKEIPLENLIKVTENLIESIYSTYPGRCPVSGRFGIRSSKDKRTIFNVLQVVKADDLTGIINKYLRNCIDHNTFVKNFSTFLNNLPDYEGIESINTNQHEDVVR